MIKLRRQFRVRKISIVFHFVFKITKHLCVTYVLDCSFSAFVLVNRTVLNRIFDELKEVRYFTRNNRFQESFNVKYFQRNITFEESSSKSSVVFRSQASVYDRTFLWIYLTAYYFRSKSSIIHIQLDYMQTFENIGIFKVTQRWSKPSRLLQRVAFLVSMLKPKVCWSRESSNMKPIIESIFYHKEHNRKIDHKHCTKNEVFN